MNKNPYLILGIDSGAKPKEIVSAYRRLARKYHPDVNKSPEAVAHMQELNWAYAVLRDPLQRAAIDRKFASYREQWGRHSGGVHRPDASPKGPPLSTYGSKSGSPRPQSPRRSNSQSSPSRPGKSTKRTIKWLLAAGPLVLSWPLMVGSPLFSILILLFSVFLFFMVREWGLGGNTAPAWGAVLGFLAPFICGAGLLPPSTADSPNLADWLGVFGGTALFFGLPTGLVGGALVARLLRRSHD